MHRDACLLQGVMAFGYFWTVWKLLQGLTNLTVNDRNKVSQEAEVAGQPHCSPHFPFPGLHALLMSYSALDCMPYSCPNSEAQNTVPIADPDVRRHGAAGTRHPLALSFMLQEVVTAKGGVQLLAKVLSGRQHNNEAAQRYALSALWNLAFNDHSRRIILETPGLVDAIRSCLAKSESPRTKEVAKGALWTLGEEGSRQLHQVRIRCIPFMWNA